MYELCPETPADTPEVETLMDLCFAPGRTALSSYRLREGVPAVAPLCLLLRNEYGVPVGAIRYWPVRVGGKPVLLLGPVAVHPTTQGEGLGGFLMRESLNRAARMGWARVMLVGDLPYYGRFGFRKLEGVEMPPPTNPERVLGLELVPGAWTGVAGAVERETGRDVAAGIEEMRRDPPQGWRCVEVAPKGHSAG
ncbi:Predicted N-acetyltransferase YhbS [Paracoccus aminovorans]|uniref:Predicted N-acetyltransferase YhbS n=1 Tax=Paracoccus aminovorans TaxID=34004 RepID=A0A1I3D2E0_9RHOB|nr:N-acetyltransferase [Paracoccus aminovorans]CQR86743.1 GCN5-related N-acetyltransferase [Paracoccus aminovorans]SFH80875.1 Predicted N-acetyltransferase YhbS [Paracoccus aminovorans]